MKKVSVYITIFSAIALMAWLSVFITTYLLMGFRQPPLWEMVIFAILTAMCSISSTIYVAMHWKEIKEEIQSL